MSAAVATRAAAAASSPVSMTNRDKSRRSKIVERSPRIGPQRIAEGEYSGQTTVQRHEDPQHRLAPKAPLARLGPQRQPALSARTSERDPARTALSSTIPSDPSHDTREPHGDWKAPIPSCAPSRQWIRQGCDATPVRATQAAARLSSGSRPGAVSTSIRSAPPGSACRSCRTPPVRTSASASSAALPFISIPCARGPRDAADEGDRRRQDQRAGRCDHKHSQRADRIAGEMPGQPGKDQRRGQHHHRRSGRPCG